jgi:hypothetical protein
VLGMLRFSCWDQKVGFGWVWMYCDGRAGLEC